MSTGGSIHHQEKHIQHNKSKFRHRVTASLISSMSTIKAPPLQTTPFLQIFPSHTPLKNQHFD
ncbi:hypothetical protein QJS10_CPB04g00636 [Acorus calamus]|uniref:Uncharacterized protein n=1 Tax=Acorus calamus TaxID=4465 RepID=A0AAV9F2P1_ACOCL|nr:hypothetical protein QJS10_CPB04g00636 [Acorus calamus]